MKQNLTRNALPTFLLRAEPRGITVMLIGEKSVREGKREVRRPEQPLVSPFPGAREASLEWGVARLTPLDKLIKGGRGKFWMEWTPSPDNLRLFTELMVANMGLVTG